MENNINQTIATITSELNWRSENASATSRRLCLGVVATVWGLLSIPLQHSISSWQHSLMILAGITAITSLFLDWLQSIVGYYAISSDFDRIYSNTIDSDVKPFTISRKYQASGIAFTGKIFLAPLSFALLIIAIVPVLVSH